MSAKDEAIFLEGINDKIKKSEDARSYIISEVNKLIVTFKGSIGFFIGENFQKFIDEINTLKGYLGTSNSSVKALTTQMQGLRNSCIHLTETLGSVRDGIRDVRSMLGFALLQKT